MAAVEKGCNECDYYWNGDINNDKQCPRCKSYNISTDCTELPPDSWEPEDVKWGET